MEETNDENYVLYMHKNKINGKMYFGITGVDKEKRWANGKGYHIGTHFRNAIDKYGWDNFEHIVLKENLTEEDALMLEYEYIILYDTANRENGYNIAKYGSNRNIKPIYVYNYKTLELIGLYRTIKDASVNLNVGEKNIMLCCRGSNSYCYGDFYFTHDNLGDKLPNEIFDEINEFKFKNHNAYYISRYDLFGNYIETFNSRSEACKKYNVRYISDGCVSLLDNIWIIHKTYEEYNNRKNSISVEELINLTRNKKSLIPCNQYDLNGKYIKTYNNIYDAAKDVGCFGREHLILRCCQKKVRFSNGYIWRFYYQYSDCIDLDNQDMVKIKNESNKCDNNIRINVYSMEGCLIETFNNIDDASNSTGLDKRKIKKCCKRILSYTNNLIFRYENDVLTEEDIYNAHNKAHSPFKKKVGKYSIDDVLIETYESIAEAARVNNVRRECIRDCCNGRQPTAYGFKWKIIV